MALGQPTAVTIEEMNAVLTIAQELARAPLSVLPAQALAVAQPSLHEELDEVVRSLELVQANRNRLSRLLSIDEISSVEELARHRREWIGAQGDLFAFLRSGYRQSRAYLRRLLGRAPNPAGVRTLGDIENLLRSEQQLVRPPLLPEIWNSQWKGASTSTSVVRDLQTWLKRLRNCIGERTGITLEQVLQAASHPAIAATQGVSLQSVTEDLRRALEPWNNIAIRPDVRLDHLNVRLDSIRERTQRLAESLRQAHVAVDVVLHSWVNDLEQIPQAVAKRAELSRLSGLEAPATWVNYPLAQLAPTAAWINNWQNGNGALPVLVSLLTQDGLEAARATIAAAQRLDLAIAAFPAKLAGMVPGRLNIPGPIEGLAGQVRSMAHAVQVVSNLTSPLPSHTTLELGVLHSILKTGRKLTFERRWVEPWSVTCQHAFVGSDHAAVETTLSWFRSVRGEHTPDAVVSWVCAGTQVEERWTWWQSFVQAMRVTWTLWRQAVEQGVVTTGDTAPAVAIFPWHDRIRERLGQWRSARHNLATYVIEGADPTLRQLTAVLDDVERAMAIETELVSWDETLGVQAVQICPDVIRQHQACATNLVQAHPVLRSWLLHPEITERHQLLTTMAVSLHNAQEAVKRTRDDMESKGQVRGQGPSELFNAHMPVGDLLMVVNRLIAGIDTLLPTAHFSREESRAYSLGLSEMIVRMRVVRLSADACVRTFQAAVRHQQAAACIASIPELNAFAGKSYADQVRAFSQHERSLLDNNKLRIQNQIRDRDVTQGRSGSKVSTLTELQLLQREWNRQSKRLPIRRLVERGGTAMRDLCPCWLMTPIAIAQFLSNTLPPFDVVVMDEASQLDPEDALGAILRAKQSIIVGDPKQMPPSSFFESSDEEDESDNEEEESGIKAESVLDMALSSLPQSCLQWHYRSLHQTLIAPANSFS